MLRKRDFNKIKFEKQLKKTNVVQENVLDMRKKVRKKETSDLY